MKDESSSFLIMQLICLNTLFIMGQMKSIPSDLRLTSSANMQ